jgi:hypothetical protein
MRKLLRLVCLVVVIAVAVVPPVMADEMTCVAGLRFNDPLTGEMVDCLESVGNDCLSCTMIIVIRR